jgi:hypothetical protein
VHLTRAPSEPTSIVCAAASSSRTARPPRRGRMAR